MVFEGADGTFSGISMVNAGRRELEVNVFLVEELFQGLGAFIVKALEARV